MDIINIIATNITASITVSLVVIILLVWYVSVHNDPGTRKPREVKETVSTSAIHTPLSPTPMLEMVHAFAWPTRMVDCRTKHLFDYSEIVKRSKRVTAEELGPAVSDGSRAVNSDKTIILSVNIAHIFMGEDMETNPVTPVVWQHIKDNLVVIAHYYTEATHIDIRNLGNNERDCSFGISPETELHEYLSKYEDIHAVNAEITIKTTDAVLVKTIVDELLYGSLVNAANRPTEVLPYENGGIHIRRDFSSFAVHPNAECSSAMEIEVTPVYPDWDDHHYIKVAREYGHQLANKQNPARQAIRVELEVPERKVESTEMTRVTPLGFLLEKIILKRAEPASDGLLDQYDKAFTRNKTLFPGSNIEALTLKDLLASAMSYDKVYYQDGAVYVNKDSETILTIGFEDEGMLTLIRADAPILQVVNGTDGDFRSMCDLYVMHIVKMFECGRGYVESIAKIQKDKGCVMFDCGMKGDDD